MAMKGYPKDRCASYGEKGQVKDSGKIVSNAGKENMKTGRAGKGK